MNYKPVIRLYEPRDQLDYFEVRKEVTKVTRGGSLWLGLTDQDTEGE